MTSLGDYAFLGCINLTNITISDSVTNIGDKAFDNVSSSTLTIVCNPGSYAETWATNHKYPVQYVDDYTQPDIQEPDIQLEGDSFTLGTGMSVDLNDLLDAPDAVLLA